jgi:hypothetical protein
LSITGAGEVKSAGAGQLHKSYSELTGISTDRLIRALILHRNSDAVKQVLQYAKEYSTKHPTGTNKLSAAEQRIKELEQQLRAAAPAGAAP